MKSILIVVMAVVTALLRFLPFLIWNGKRKTPEVIVYLGKVLPYSIMAMLVVYCLKDITFLRKPFGIPENLASVAVILVHLWKRNTLISIILGTAVYMILIQGALSIILHLPIL